MTRIIFDLDGVIADYHSAENFYENIYNPEFFRKLNPFSAMVAAVKELSKNPEYDVRIVSKCANSAVRNEKYNWLNRHIGYENEVGIRRHVIDDNKSYADFFSENGGLKKSDILIDDFNENLRDWYRNGGSGILCLNSTSHLRKSGTEWSGESITNNANIQTILENLNVAIEQTIVPQTVKYRFYNEVFPFYYPVGFYGDVLDKPEQINSCDIADKIDEINECVFNKCSNLTELGLIGCFNHNDTELEAQINEKVKSMEQYVEEINGDVMWVSECEISDELTNDELEVLKEFIAGQNSDGLGESLEQTEFPCDKGKLTIKLWDKDYRTQILTEAEFAQSRGFAYEPPQFESSQSFSGISMN